MKKILVPTDFSLPSKASYRFAVDLAARAHAEIHVVHMIEIPLLTETTFGVQPPPSDTEMSRKITASAQHAFKAMTREYSRDIPVEFKTVTDDIVPGICDYVLENNIDLVVMSTHGSSALEEFFIGSTAEKLARLSPAPVICVPRQTNLETIRNIVFPSTLETGQDDLIGDLKQLQKLLDARLHVLLINTPQNFYSDREAREKLERFAAQHHLTNFTLNFRNHRFERTGIVTFTNEINGDMIAMSTHGRTGFAHFFKRSIAEGLLDQIDQPIWIWNLKTHKKAWRSSDDVIPERRNDQS